ncbi:MAG TPA: hypothetical protein VE988_23615 [Gemmataceae bacterium]|nr:hypothetical protein [Gemmataceae bacterium]
MTKHVMPESTAVVPQQPDDVEDYTPERIAEFLLNNAVDAASYQAACAEVRALGLEPERIPHVKPARE